MGDERSSFDEFDEALRAADAEVYLLRLYVAGATPRSQRAIANLARLCEEDLSGRYTLEVIDVFQRPQLAVDEQIFAAPTLVRLLPEPVARVVGDLSDRESILVGLDLRPGRR